METDVKRLLRVGTAATLTLAVLDQASATLSRWLFPFDFLAEPGVRGTNDPRLMLFTAYYPAMGFAMAYAYERFRTTGSRLQRGLRFGWLVWLLGGLPTALLGYAALVFPVGFTVQSFIGSWIGCMGTAAVIARLRE